MDNTNREQILDKIRKLHALANNAGTEAEAANAASKVADLCFKHNLEIGSIQLEDEEVSASEAIDEFEGNNKRYRYPLSKACEILFNVGCYQRRQGTIVKGKWMRGGAMVFYGLRANVESALVTYRYFVASVDSMFDGYVNEGNHAGGGNGNSFRHGCARRICDESEKQAEHSNAFISGNTECMAIVHIGDRLVKQHGEKLHLRKTSSNGSPINHDAYAAGYRAGGRVNLHGANNRMLT